MGLVLVHLFLLPEKIRSKRRPWLWQRACSQLLPGYFPGCNFTWSARCIHWLAECRRPLQNTKCRLYTELGSELKSCVKCFYVQLAWLSRPANYSCKWAKRWERRGHLWRKIEQTEPDTLIPGWDWEKVSKVVAWNFCQCLVGPSIQFFSLKVVLMLGGIICIVSIKRLIVCH